LFQFINDNFLHPPSVDLSRESIKVLVDLMLAQAQECFIDKVLFENKSGNLVAKLAMHVAFMYNLILEGFKEPSLKHQFPRAWIEICTVKSKYYHALSNFHRSILAENENEYGQVLAYLELANKSAQEAIKIGTNFLSSFPSFLAGLESIVSPTTPSVPTTTVAEDLLTICKQLGTHIGERLQVAIKDNDLIYHAPAIPPEALPTIDKLNAVKMIPFHDLLPNGQKDLPSIIGYDLFQRLIPLGVHESSSIYSDSKDKLLRTQKENVENADVELHVQMESLQIMNSLEQLKQALKRTHTTSVQPPESLLASITVVIAEEQGPNSLDSLLKNCESGISTLKRAFDEISQLLDREQYECEQMRVFMY
jgi:hypothetical protein